MAYLGFQAATPVGHNVFSDEQLDRIDWQAVRQRLDARNDPVHIPHHVAEKHKQQQQQQQQKQ